MNRARLTKLLSEDWEKVEKEMGQELLKMLDASEAHQAQVNALKTKIKDLEDTVQIYSTAMENNRAVLKESLTPIQADIAQAFDEIKDSKSGRTKKFTVTLSFTREQLRILAGLCREYGTPPVG